MAASNVTGRLKLLAAGMWLAAALLLAAWLLGYFERDDNLSDDPAVADLQRAMQQSEKADIALLKQKYKQLTPKQQREFAVRKMVMSLPQQERKLRDFFTLPEAEQRERIDREIDAIEAKRRQAGAVAGPNEKGPSGGNAVPERIMSMKQEWTANASPELRAMMDRRVRMLNERLAERGLAPL